MKSRRLSFKKDQTMWAADMVASLLRISYLFYCDNYRIFVMRQEYELTYTTQQYYRVITQ